MSPFIENLYLPKPFLRFPLIFHTLSSKLDKIGEEIKSIPSIVVLFLKFSSFSW